MAYQSVFIPLKKQPHNSFGLCGIMFPFCLFTKLMMGYLPPDNMKSAIIAMSSMFVSPSPFTSVL